MEAGSSDKPADNLMETMEEEEEKEAAAAADAGCDQFMDELEEALPKRPLKNVKDVLDYWNTALEKVRALMPVVDPS